jgi:hypothetical protein
MFSAGLILCSCADRERSNPLDPQNTKTGGRLSGVSVLSREREVTVSWDAVDVKGIDGIRIYRRLSDEHEFAQIGSTGSSADAFIDSAAEYAKTYEYYVTAVTGNYESPPSAIVQVTPGPTYTWVADAYSGYVTRLTHDLKTTLFSFGILNFPYRVAPVPKERAAWIYSRFSDAIYKIDAYGERQITLLDYGEVSDMAVDTTSNDLWISLSSHGILKRLDSQGEEQLNSHSLAAPQALAVDSHNHFCWVVDKKVYSLEDNGTIRAGSEVLISPKDIAISLAREVVWVADSLRVVQLDFSAGFTGIVVDSLTYARLIAYDEVRDECWVVDQQLGTLYANLLKIDGAGKIVTSVENFVTPRSIAVNQYDGSCLLGDSGYAQLFRISNDGGRVDVIGDFIAPYDVAVEHH